MVTESSLLPESEIRWTGTLGASEPGSYDEVYYLSGGNSKNMTVFEIKIL